MDKIFIEQAKQIRREYIKNAKEVVKCESRIEIYKEDLIKLQRELNEKMDTDLIRDKLILIEKNIKSIEKILDPFNMKIKKLEKDADKLFDNIKERHPNLTPEDIQNELIPHLAEIKF